MNLIIKFKQKLDKLLSNISNPELILALSGGLDSVVLLDLLVNILVNYNYKNKITAIYIDHGLQEDSKYWVNFNHNLVENYKNNKLSFNYYKLDLIKNNLNNNSNKLYNNLGLEAYAREARYNIFKKIINTDNKILLTAHHLNDQAETFILQLMRAAGPKGLSAMPDVKKFSYGYHIRPLLDYSRKELLNYAKQNNLNWVEDKTNLDVKFDRNFIRHNIINILEQKWPHSIANIAKSAKYCAEYDDLLQDYIKKDYDNCSLCLSDHNINIFKNINLNYLKFNNILNINKLKLLDDFYKIKAIIRYWFNDGGLKLPGEKVITEIINSIIYTKADSKSEVLINNELYNIKITKFKSYLFVLDNNIINNNLNINNGFLYKIDANKYNIKYSNFNSSDKFILKNKNCSITYKKLLQENNIPYWQRKNIPVLYIDNKIVGIALYSEIIWLDSSNY